MVDSLFCILCILTVIWFTCANSNDAYIGCFYDNYRVSSGDTDTNFCVLPLGELKSTEMTIGGCITHCVKFRNDIQFAGLEIGTQCFCGTADADYDQGGFGRRSDEDCSEPCAGNVNQACGNDFSIAVYNLSYIHCPVPQEHNFVNSDKFIPVQENITFECLPDYSLIGTSSVQCIFDDTITNTRWATNLPMCIEADRSTPTSTGNTQLASTTTDNIPQTTYLTSNAALVARPAAGGVVVLIICAIVIAVVCLCKRRQNVGNGESTPTPASTTQAPQDSSYEPSPPVYAMVNKDTPAYATVQRDDSIESNQDDPPDEKRVELSKQQRTDQLYSYADVTINSSPAPDVHVATNGDDETEESGWAENTIYSRTEGTEEQQEGWNDNNLYATTSE